ncbi:nuclear receptor family 2 group C protein [Perilla frutescens var. hirtella]|uniref:Nuclear receptor family 2 group C protein n=1 Tax=Perilla frutescens var. hirtella TaxID=608512 RepID=A0AAD4PBZ7_PERFH|nr:nuclear receptor family 2 group C protein [Perilla frutescens var. hirtella]
MAKKRKSDATRLDEVDRGMYTAFCGAANSLSQLYSQAVNHQRLSFQAGERHSMEKLYSWILRQQENGIRVMPGDILAYVQNELDYGTEDTPSLPLLHQQQSQTATQSAHSGHPVSSNAFGPSAVGQGLRSGEQTKNSVFSNALSSPVRRSLQHYHLSHGGSHYSNNATRSNDSNGNQTRDPNPPSSNDTSMDMHADSPGHDSPY